jgi:hypothetical protein
MGRDLSYTIFLQRQKAAGAARLQARKDTMTPIDATTIFERLCPGFTG